MATQAQPTIGEGFLSERKFNVARLTDQKMFEWAMYKTNRDLCSPDFRALMLGAQGSVVLLDCTCLVDLVTNPEEYTDTSADGLDYQRFIKLAFEIAKDQESFLLSGVKGRYQQFVKDRTQNHRQIKSLPNWIIQLQLLTDGFHEMVVKLNQYQHIRQNDRNKGTLREDIVITNLNYGKVHLTISTRFIFAKQTLNR
jgi:hypothetical protein